MRCPGARSASATLLFCAFVLFEHAGAQSPLPAAERALAREILKELVEMPTTEADGTARAAEAMATRLAAAGFPSEDVRILGAEPKTANLVARFRGPNPRAPALLLMAHVDVVPASREDWSVDPFTLTERDGWFYGRGTSDNKAGVATLIANLIRLKRDGWQPARDVVVLVTGDEETAQRGVRWLLAEHRSLVDAEVAFNTDGGGVMTREGRPVFFDVQASEKIYADYQLEVTDAGGHSSLVRPGNPVYTLAAALTRIAEHHFPLQVSEVTRMFFERSALTERGQTAADLRAVAAVPPDPAAAARLSRSPYLNARLRTTCVATRVDAGHANNALPQRARAIVNCRILPGTPGKEVEAVLARLAGDKVTLTVVEPPVSSPPSPLPPALLGRLEPLVARYWPEVPVIPTMLAGATDGMYTRSAGIPTYGISALDQDPEDVRAHGKDERVGVEAFYTSTQFWFELIRTFGDGAP
jgi:acetylornithine deacetylase/succinyl-diaminopimelate desuccinylase-like protein